jgi:CheY-like chemotaxis protein
MESTTQERRRLVALRRHQILDTPPEETFDKITSLLARLLGAPSACVSLVDEVRVWFKSAHGVDVDEVSREPGLCSTTIERDAVHYLEDVALHPEARKNSLVDREGGVRFYVGAPLTTADGHRIGTLCAFGPEPRKLAPEHLELVETLAGLVMHEIVYRREWGAIDPRHQGTILVVDDDELILALIRRALERVGFQILTAATHSELLEHLAVHGTGLDAAILDAGLPSRDISAARLALADSSPTAGILLCGMPMEVEAGFGAADGFLEKPFGPHELLEAVRAVVRV